MSNILNLNDNQHFARSDLCLNCLQTKVISKTSMQRVQMFHQPLYFGMILVIGPFFSISKDVRLSAFLHSQIISMGKAPYKEFILLFAFSKVMYRVTCTCIIQGSI